MTPDLTPEIDFSVRLWPERNASREPRLLDLWQLYEDPIEIAELTGLAAIDLLEQIRALREELSAALALLREYDGTKDRLREQIRALSEELQAALALLRERERTIDDLRKPSTCRE